MTTLNEIATNAHHIKKPTKNELFAELNNTVFSVPGDYLTDNTLAMLYAYFLPTSSKKPKTPEQWVAMVVAKNDVRGYLNFLYVDASETNGVRLVAADGPRMHILHGVDLAAGYYDTALNQVDYPDKYVNFDRIIPTSGESDQLWIDDVKKLPINAAQTSGENCHSIEINGSHFNVNYINDALAGFDATKPVDTLQLDVLSPLKLSQGDLLAVVMPMRV